jgi:hypothetical protein
MRRPIIQAMRESLAFAPAFGVADQGSRARHHATRGVWVKCGHGWDAVVTEQVLPTADRKRCGAEDFKVVPAISDPETTTLPLWRTQQRRATSSAIDAMSGSWSPAQNQ